MDITRRIITSAVRLPSWAKGLSVPDKHQLRIALDTIENPSKALLGGPSVDEAKEIVAMLRERSGGRRGSAESINAQPWHNTDWWDMFTPEPGGDRTRYDRAAALMAGLADRMHVAILSKKYADINGIMDEFSRVQDEYSDLGAGDSEPSMAMAQVVIESDPSLEEIAQKVRWWGIASRIASAPKRIAKRIIAGAMKRWLEEVSVDMGLDGEITDEVIAESQRRLDSEGKPSQTAPPLAQGSLKSPDQLLKEIPAIDGMMPEARVNEEGVLQFSAEEGDGILDYYGEFTGGYPYIHPNLLAWASSEGYFFEWENPGVATMHEA